MFTQQKLLFQFTKAIALVILFCFTFSCQVQGEKALQEKAKDMKATTIEEVVTAVAVSPVVDMAEITAQVDIEDLEEKFVEYIEALFDDLEGKFRESEFDEMAELLADYTILATPQGKRLKGKWNLSKFWRKVKNNGTTEVDFTSLLHYVSEVTEPIEQGEDTIDAVGHAIIEYRLITLKKGGTLTNQKGTLALNRRHPRICEWGE